MKGQQSSIAFFSTILLCILSVCHQSYRILRNSLKRTRLQETSKVEKWTQRTSPHPKQKTKRTHTHKAFPIWSSTSDYSKPKFVLRKRLINFQAKRNFPKQELENFLVLKYLYFANVNFLQAFAIQNLVSILKSWKNCSFISWENFSW